TGPEAWLHASPVLRGLPPGRRAGAGPAALGRAAFARWVAPWFRPDGLRPVLLETGGRDHQGRAAFFAGETAAHVLRRQVVHRAAGRVGTGVLHEGPFGCWRRVLVAARIAVVCGPCKGDGPR